MLGSHCNVIPEPPDASNMIYLPEEDSNLVLLSEYGRYGAEVTEASGASVKVHKDYGRDKEFIVDGYLPDVIGEGDKLPTFEIFDAYSNPLLKYATMHF